MGGENSGRRKVDDTWAPAPGTEPWERQPCDTDRSWEAFVVYRDMTGRSMPKVSEVMGKSDTYHKQLAQWSTDHGWRRRVEAWDAHKDAVNVEAQLEARRAASRDMVDRHLKISTHLQRLASIELMRWIHKVGGDTDNPDMRAEPVLIPQHIQSLLDYAIKLERLNRNEPESITETREKTMSKEELETRIKHLLKTRCDE